MKTVILIFSLLAITCVISEDDGTYNRDPEEGKYSPQAEIAREVNTVRVVTAPRKYVEKTIPQTIPQTIPTIPQTIPQTIPRYFNHQANPQNYYAHGIPQNYNPQHAIAQNYHPHTVRQVSPQLVQVQKPIPYNQPALKYVDQPLTNSAVNVQARTLKSESDVGPTHYRYLYETDNGIMSVEEGQLTNPGTEQEAIQVTGEFRYLAPDGVVYAVAYVADENGFHPVGAHLPVPPQHPTQ